MSYLSFIKRESVLSESPSGSAFMLGDLAEEYDGTIYNRWSRIAPNTVMETTPIGRNTNGYRKGFNTLKVLFVTKTDNSTGIIGILLEYLPN